MQIQPYLFFDGRCDEAIEFYRGALGAEVTMLMRFKESPIPDVRARFGGQGDAREFAHRRNDHPRFRRSLPGTAELPGVLTVTHGPDDAAAERLFAALADGGRCRCR